MQRYEAGQDWQSLTREASEKQQVRSKNHPSSAPASAEEWLALMLVFIARVTTYKFK
jgi:hypothetical protein